jgi:hypothetical protein
MSFEGYSTRVVCVYKRLQDPGVDAGFTNGLAHGLEKIESAHLDGTLALVVDEQRALLGLFGRVLAYANQRGDNVLECVYVVVEDHEVHLVDGFGGFHYLYKYFFLVSGLHGFLEIFKDTKVAIFRVFGQRGMGRGYAAFSGWGTVGIGGDAEWDLLVGHQQMGFNRDLE